MLKLSVFSSVPLVQPWDFLAVWKTEVCTDSWIIKALGEAQRIRRLIVTLLDHSATVYGAVVGKDESEILIHFEDGTVGHFDVGMGRELISAKRDRAASVPPAMVACFSQ
ncbi:MAG: hypothetical protein ACR2Q4_04055 [Geminicoccaceae bacterium]